MNPSRKTVWILAVVLAAYAGLVVTHEGEFWPFSIYQMFSSAGRPWSRALVREVPPGAPDTLLWRPVRLDALPGSPFALSPSGPNQNDLSEYLARTTRWDPARRAGLRKMFEVASARHPALLICQARGVLGAGNDVSVTVTPTALLTPDSLILNPNLFASAPR